MGFADACLGGGWRSCLSGLAVLLLPSLALAHGALTGTVRDASGAVLPGVTVEASSEALIERVRTATSDETGQWRIVDLRPGVYRLSFTLTGVQNPTLVEYRFNQRSPNQFTVNLPDWQTAGRTVQHSVYAQDQWTLRRLTLSAAVRYDHAYSWSPAEGNGTTRVSPYNP
jgi:hypothetical protein